MRSFIRLGLATVAAAALAGCGANENLAPDASTLGTTSSDEAAVSQVISESPDIVEDGLMEALDETPLGDMGGGGGLADAGVEAPIDPLRFWRRIRSVERTFEFEFLDNDENDRPTLAKVRIHKTLKGTFNIAVGDPLSTSADPQRDIKVIQKPLVDHAIRNVVLQRVPDDQLASTDRHRRAWRLVGASGVEITSRVADAVQTRIRSMRIQAGPLDTTITDPLALRRLHQVLKFEPEMEVELTVTTDAPDDVVVLMHRDRRFRFEANGDNTYTGKWRVPLRQGFHHLGVNALANGTLFDDEAPYSSQGWVLHFVVRGAEPVAALEPQDP